MTVSTTKLQFAVVPKHLQKVVMAGTAMVIAFGLMLALMMFWVPGIVILLISYLTAILAGMYPAAGPVATKPTPLVYWSIVGASTTAMTVTGVLSAVMVQPRLLKDGTIDALAYNGDIAGWTVFFTIFVAPFVVMGGYAVYIVFEFIKMFVLRIARSLHA